jgi:hypothetical protein
LTDNTGACPESIRRWFENPAVSVEALVGARVILTRLTCNRLDASRMGTFGCVQAFTEQARGAVVRAQREAGDMGHGQSRSRDARRWAS